MFRGIIYIDLVISPPLKISYLKMHLITVAWAGYSQWSPVTLPGRLGLAMFRWEQEAQLCPIRLKDSHLSLMNFFTSFTHILTPTRPIVVHFSHQINKWMFDTDCSKSALENNKLNLLHCSAWQWSQRWLQSNEPEINSRKPFLVTAM